MQALQGMVEACVRDAHAGVGRVGGHLAWLVRLLTALVLLATALLIVALVGQGVAGARDLVPQRQARDALPAPRPREATAVPGATGFAPAEQDARALLDRLDDPPQAPAASAAGAHGDTPRRGDGSGGATRPNWAHARQEQPVEVTAAPGATSGPDDRARRPPLPPGSVTVADLAGGSGPVQTAWSWRWPWSKSPQPSPSSPASPQAPPPVWPGVTFAPGATVARPDSDEQLVVPWGQVKLLSNGGLKTYDGSQIAFGRVSLETQGLGEPVVDDKGNKRYPNGIVDYPPGRLWARFLPKTDTMLSRDRKVLVWSQTDRTKPAGEVTPDGTYLSHADNTRWFPDGTRLAGKEWFLPGGLRVTEQGRLVKEDGTEIDLDQGPYYVGRGTRVRAGGVVDFAGGASGLPGGAIIANARRADELLPGQSAREAEGPEASTSVRDMGPRERETHANWLETALENRRYELVNRLWRPGTRAELDRINLATRALRAEYEDLREVQPYPPELDDVRSGDLVLRAQGLRGQIDAELEAIDQDETPERPVYLRAWSTYGHDKRVREHLRGIDDIAEALWWKPKRLSARLAEVQAWPDSDEKQAELEKLRIDVEGAEIGYTAIRQEVPVAPRYNDWTPEELWAKVASVAAKLADNRYRWTALDPDAPDAAGQWAAFEEREEVLVKQLTEFYSFLNRAGIPPPKTPLQPYQPPPGLEQPSPQHKLEVPGTPEVPATMHAGTDGSGRDTQPQAEPAPVPTAIADTGDTGGGDTGPRVTAGQADGYAGVGGVDHSPQPSPLDPGQLQQQADIDGSSFLDGADLG
ncbi:MAG TPA: hypothetical protein VKG45_16925 [Actinomycetes bacterium]|nr:hypothetical protein [Actinomycetes bacterium]